MVAPDAQLDEPRTLLIKGGLVMLDPRRQPQPADLVVEKGAITSVGPNLRRPGPDTELIDATGHLVIPGLVNAHTHAHNSLARGAIDGLPLELWLLQLGARVVNRTPREIYVGAAIGAIEMAKTGATGACDMVGVLPWPTEEALDAVLQAYRDVGLRVTVAPQVADRGPMDSLEALGVGLSSDIRRDLTRAPAYPRTEVLHAVERTIQRWNGSARGTIRVGVAASIMTLCTPELLDGCRQLTRQYAVPFQTHLSETKGSAYVARQMYGMSPTAKLDELGLLGPSTLLAHSVWVDDEELRLIATSGSSISHNPISNLKLGAGIAPLRRMLDNGCNVALGTDGSASSDNQNLFGTLREAAILHRAFEPRYDDWLGAGDVIEMATANAARATGFDDVGSIQPGKRADLVLLDLTTSYFHPRNDLLGQLVYAEVGSSVRTVLVDGHVIVRDGRMTTVDEASLLAEADFIAQRISGALDASLAAARRLEPYVRLGYERAAAWSLVRDPVEP